MEVDKSKYCVIYKDMEIIIILDVMLIKSVELTQIIQADHKLELCVCRVLLWLCYQGNK